MSEETPIVSEYFKEIVEKDQGKFDLTLKPQRAKEVVDEITALCDERSKDGQRVMWHDERDFPHDAKSINKVSGNKNIPMLSTSGFKRLHQLHKDPKLFVDGASASDIHQGKIGDCWFCAAVSAIASHDSERITKLFYPPHYNPAGIYAVNIWQNNKWEAMLIDDGLPYLGSSLVFADAGSKGEFWFPLIEKLGAKLSESYQSLIGSVEKVKWKSLRGQEGVMTLLTGGKTSSASPSPTNKSWFTTLHSYMLNGWIASLSSAKGCGNGIVTNHAYTVVGSYMRDADEEGGLLELVKVRNVWGRGEWQGDYCKGDAKIWKAEENKALALACGMTHKGRPVVDGTFWIEKKDFEKNFNSIHLCQFALDIPAQNSRYIPTVNFNSPGCVAPPPRAAEKKAVAGADVVGDLAGHDQIFVQGEPGQEIIVQISFNAFTGLGRHSFYVISLTPEEVAKASVEGSLNLISMDSSRVCFKTPPNQERVHQAHCRIPDVARDEDGHFEGDSGAVMIIPLGFDKNGKEPSYTVSIKNRVAAVKGPVQKLKCVRSLGPVEGELKSDMATVDGYSASVPKFRVEVSEGSAKHPKAFTSMNQISITFHQPPEAGGGGAPGDKAALTIAPWSLDSSQMYLQQYTRPNPKGVQLDPLLAIEFTIPEHGQFVVLQVPQEKLPILQGSYMLWVSRDNGKKGEKFALTFQADVGLSVKQV